MELRLQVCLIIISMAFAGYIFSLVRKGALELKYTLAWCLMGLILVVISIEPDLVVILSKILGIGLPVNAVFLLGIFCILIIILTITVAVSRASVRTKRLAQEIALVKLELAQIKHKEQNSDKSLIKRTD